jgi:hypothetical protein
MGDADDPDLIVVSHQRILGHELPVPGDENVKRIDTCFKEHLLKRAGDSLDLPDALVREDDLHALYRYWLAGFLNIPLEEVKPPKG